VTRNYTAEEVIRLLDLKPLTIEGGFFHETYRSAQAITLPLYRGQRSLATAIYYLLTADTFSRMHRVPGDEMFHFYLGDPVKMLQLKPDGSGEVVIMGHDIASGMKVQHVVPGGWWQGARLRPGGQFALMGTTMGPGFEYEDYTSGKRGELMRDYRGHSDLISALCPA
jgi:uncharacterized protein